MYYVYLRHSVYSPMIQKSSFYKVTNVCANFRFAVCPIREHPCLIREPNCHTVILFLPVQFIGLSASCTDLPLFVCL